MAWARLDDGFWMHPKVIIAGNAGAGIFARFLSYCACYLTDGMIPAPIARQIVGTDHDALTSLAEFGMVQVLESGSVVIPDYLEVNPSKQVVEEGRQQRREAGRKGGLARPKAGLSGPNGKRPLKPPLSAAYSTRSGGR